MEKPFTLSEGVDSWNTIIFLYNSALKEVRTKVEILNDEFQQVHQYLSLKTKTCPRDVT